MKRIIPLLLALLMACLPLSALAEAADEATAAPAIATAPILPSVSDSKLTVTGESVVTLPADMAVVSLGVRETAEDVREAQSAVNEKIAAVRAALVELGIENADITTDSLYIYANYNYSDDGDGRITSYNASNTLRVVVRDVNNACAVIDAAFAAGANTLDSVSFCASDDSAARDQAYQQAVASAMHKAEVIAEAAGMKLSSIADISVGQGYDYYDAGNYARATQAAEDSAAGAPTDIQASGVLVSASVTLTYNLSAE